MRSSETKPDSTFSLRGQAVDSLHRHVSRIEDEPVAGPNPLKVKGDASPQPTSFEIDPKIEVEVGRSDLTWIREAVGIREDARPAEEQDQTHQDPEARPVNRHHELLEKKEAAIGACRGRGYKNPQNRGKRVEGTKMTSFPRVPSPVEKGYNPVL